MLSWTLRASTFIFSLPTYYQTTILLYLSWPSKAWYRHPSSIKYYSRFRSRLTTLLCRRVLIASYPLHFVEVRGWCKWPPTLKPSPTFSVDELFLLILPAKEGHVGWNKGRCLYWGGTANRSTLHSRIQVTFNGGFKATGPEEMIWGMFWPDQSLGSIPWSRHPRQTEWQCGSGGWNQDESKKVSNNDQNLGVWMSMCHLNLDILDAY